MVTCRAATLSPDLQATDMLLCLGEQVHLTPNLASRCTHHSWVLPCTSASSPTAVTRAREEVEV